jgi:hypothetical protein
LATALNAEVDLKVPFRMKVGVRIFKRRKLMTKTIWVLEKRDKVRLGRWEFCFRSSMSGDERYMKALAKRLTEVSGYWFYRAVPYDRRKR